MVSSNYQLRYLPLFYQDLDEKILYISNNLHNPQAANNLLTLVSEAINQRLPFAESFEKDFSFSNRRIPYYRIYVKSYIIFYVVIEENGSKIMEVRRFLYNKQRRRTKKKRSPL